MRPIETVPSWVNQGRGRALLLAFIAVVTVAGANGLVEIGAALHDATCTRH